MNEARRKRIRAACEALRILKLEIEGIQSEEQDAFDNIPESLQDTQKAQASDAAAQELESAADTIEETITALEEITQ
jgi:hypothetical protein